MSWIPPKRNWTNEQQGIKAADFNRIGNNQRLINDYTNTYRLSFSGLTNRVQSDPIAGLNLASYLINVPAYHRIIPRQINAVILPDTGTYEDYFWMIGINNANRLNDEWLQGVDTYMYYTQSGIEIRDMFESNPSYTNPPSPYPAQSLTSDSVIRVSLLLFGTDTPPNIVDTDIVSFACCDFLMTVEDQRLVTVGPEQ